MRQGELGGGRRGRDRRELLRSGLVLALIVLVVLSILIVAGFVLFSKAVFKTYYIPSGAMQPTLQFRDVVLVNHIAYWGAEPKDGDIVVFDPPIPSTTRFIKRVIATPGETLRIHNGRLYRNGVSVTEPYIADPTAYDLEIKNYGIYIDGTALSSSEANIPPRDKWTAPNALPPGSYFLMGDNRNNSEDSHIWGFAQREGSFYSGPEAGRPVGPFERVTGVLAPSSHARNL